MSATNLIKKGAFLPPQQLINKKTKTPSSGVFIF